MPPALVSVLGHIIVLKGLCLTSHTLVLWVLTALLGRVVRRTARLALTAPLHCSAILPALVRVRAVVWVRRLPYRAPRHHRRAYLGQELPASRLPTRNHPVSIERLVVLLHKARLLAKQQPRHELCLRHNQTHSLRPCRRRTVLLVHSRQV
jgi:hypothetical protein